MGVETDALIFIACRLLDGLTQVIGSKRCGEPEQIAFLIYLHSSTLDPFPQIRAGRDRMY